MKLMLLVQHPHPSQGGKEHAGDKKDIGPKIARKDVGLGKGGKDDARRLVGKLRCAIPQETEANAPSTCFGNVVPDFSRWQAKNVVANIVAPIRAGPSQNVHELGTPPGHTLESHVRKETIQYLNGYVEVNVAWFAVGLGRCVAEVVPSQ